MSIDQIVNFAESPIDLLAKVGLVENQPVPSVGTLKDLLALSVRANREYGVQIYEVVTGGATSRASTYKKGERGSIYEPEKPKDAVRGVFFHTHYDETKFSLWRLLKPGKFAWHMLPSDIGLSRAFDGILSGTAGDMVANFNRRLGGYLNIVSPYGAALHIGVTKDGSENASSNDTQWEILVGNQKKKIYTAFELLDDRRSVPDPLMVWSNRWPRISTNFFLLLSWDKFQELTPIFTDVENLCFGNGVRNLVQHLKLDIPHQDSLADVASIY